MHKERKIKKGLTYLFLFQLFVLWFIVTFFLPDKYFVLKLVSGILGSVTFFNSVVMPGAFQNIPLLQNDLEKFKKISGYFNFFKLINWFVERKSIWAIVVANLIIAQFINVSFYYARKQ